MPTLKSRKSGRVARKSHKGQSRGFPGLKEKVVFVGYMCAILPSYRVANRPPLKERNKMNQDTPKEEKAKPSNLCTKDDCGERRLAKKDSPNGLCFNCQDDEALMIAEFTAMMEDF